MKYFWINPANKKFPRKGSYSDSGVISWTNSYHIQLKDIAWQENHAGDQLNQSEEAEEFGGFKEPTEKEGEERVKVQNEV